MIPNIQNNFNFNLGKDVDLLKGSIEDFCAGEIAPIADEIDKKNDFPLGKPRLLKNRRLQKKFEN